MIINNLKVIRESRGFTIVELLVVIVVIGILAAITLVSYTGVTSKANTVTNKHNADNVRRAAQIVYTNTGVFPATSATSATVITNLNASDAKIPSSLTVTNGAVTSGTAITYVLKVTGSTATGICVGYWDYSGSGSAVWIYSGDATTGTSGTPSTCT